jgi:hypothetical protein
MVYGDEACNDDFHIRQELVNTRDTRFLYLQTYAINAPNGIGDGFTARAGFKIFLLWTVGFADGTEQTYLAIVHLKGDPCEEHGWSILEAALHVSTLMSDRIDGPPPFSFYFRYSS